MDNNPNDPNNPNQNIIRRMEEKINEEEGIEENQKKLNARILELEATMTGLQRINSSLAHLTIDETYKNFYDWKVRPAIDIVALMSSSASNVANVANQYSNNVYAKKHEVKRALKISERLLDEVDKGLDLFDIEIKCLLDANGTPPQRKKK
ncbi:MAG: hypothetical protein ACRCWG_09375 [Sarcina sp.]